MKLSDITVEVRDINLNRVAVIPPRELNIQIEQPHNNVGTWSISASANTPIADALRVPGSGILVWNKEVELFSGPTTKPQFTATSEDPDGTIKFEGVSDDIYFSDALAWPDPANLIGAQTKQQDTRSGTAEAIIHAFVNANIGPGAHVARQKARLIMGPSQNRGALTQKSARFDVLGEVLSGVAKVADLGFRIVQRGANLRFETYAVVDRTDFIRLDVRNNTLLAQKLSIAAPEITHALVIGKGADKAAGATVDPPRSLQMYTTAQSVEAQADWGRRIERVVNSTATDVAAELQQAGLEELVDKGFTNVNVQVSPLENNGMNFGVDWGLGDRVVVVVDDAEYVSYVTKFQLRADNTGFYLGAGLGDPSEFDPTVALRKRLALSGARISALERNG